jgi:hypothetical protein
MTEVPKIVYDRLRAASQERTATGQEPPERTHPDADLLTGFTEQTLSETEREGLLNHLSLCGECREVIVLALPAAEIPAQANTVHATTIRTKGATDWWRAFTTPSLRWTALAAAAAIIVAVLVVRPGSLDHAKRTSANPQVADTLSSAPTHQIAPSPTDRSSLNSAMNAAPMNESVATLKSEKSVPLPQPERHRSERLNPGHDVTPAMQAESGMTLADNKTDSGPAGKMPSAPGKRGANEIVEPTGASPVVQAEASPAPDDSLMAQNDAQPVIKSKPAAETEASQLQGTVSPNTAAQLSLTGRNVTSMAKAAVPAMQPAAKNLTWSITAGVLQRSRDGGHTWRNALQSDHAFLCYASNGQEVWTGGQAGTLFHSADGGLTWVRLQPSIKAQQLSSDITHIELRSRLEIAVSTVTHEVWISGDGGGTWGMAVHSR